MDENFSRYGNQIIVGVSSEKMLKVFDSIPASLKVRGKNFFAKKISSKDDIYRYKVVYIDSNWRKYYSDIIKNNDNKTPPLIFCFDDSFLYNNSGSISFKIINGKPKILYNSKNIKTQGSVFNNKFLKIAIKIEHIKK